MQFLCIDNLNWEAMAAVMRTRSAQQMRTQWYSRLAADKPGPGGAAPRASTATPEGDAAAALKASPGPGGDGPWSRSDDAALVRALHATGASEESEVDWGSLLRSRSGPQCLRRWRMLVKSVWAHVDKGFSACVDELRRTHARA